MSPNIATSISRLEIMGAIVGVRLTTRVSEVLGVNITKSTFWCDSVLWLVRGRSHNFKPFVANRVGEIQPTQTQHRGGIYLLESIQRTCLIEGCTPTTLHNIIHVREDPHFYKNQLNKMFDKPIGDDEMKKFPTQRTGFSVQEPMGNQENHHTCLASLAGETFPVDPTCYST